jgi:tRNA threonylcarbamoyladenosine biosynthesis protein TsaB
VAANNGGGMLILALDTSGDMCSVALARGDGTVRSVFSFQHERRLSERLPGAITFVLNDAQTTLADVDALAVGLGPGSFTGVRVGVTMAKTLAQALDRPVVGVCSLAALAAPLLPLLAAAGGDALLAAVSPARRGEVIAAFYDPAAATLAHVNTGGSDAPGDAMAPLAPPAVVPVAEVGARAAALLPAETARARRLVVCGEDAALLAEIAAAVPVALFSSTTVVTASVSGSALARLAAARLASGEISPNDAASTARTLVPLYVAPTPVG